MRMNSITLGAFGALLLAFGAANVRAEAPFYNPSNAANPSGKTTGYELNKTIGCPGRGLLDAPCADDQPAAKPAPAPAPIAKPTPPVDSDGDGVPDGLDQCPNTPPGAKVDAKGCPLDSDGDGVPDDLDQCPNTPPGVKVDAKGCPLDSDGDGVADHVDQCPNTPAGDRVDVNGCPQPKVINFKDVNFDNDQATLRSDAIAILDDAAATLQRYPSVKIEIAGHTDTDGTPEHNIDLSERRAKAVMDYFVSKGISADRMTTKAYGETHPIANEYLEDGRAKNRRAEMHGLN